MTDKELKSLSRAELLEMLIAVTKDNESLRDENNELQKKLDDKKINMSKAGSIAEASLQLNGVFSAAEAAAAQYLENIRNQEQMCKRMQDEAEEKAAKTVASAQLKADELEAKAKQESERYWQAVSTRLEKFYDEHRGLRELLGIKSND